MKNFKKGMSFLLIFVLALSMTFVTGCSKKEDSELKKVVVTVNDSKITLEDMMFYIYAVEAQGNYYEQMYQSYFGTSYWDTEYEKGVTIRQMLKKYVMDTIVMNEILYEKAVAEKIELTKEEKEENAKNTKEMFAGLSESVIKQTGFTEDKLLAVQERTAIVYKYQDSIVEGFDIDDAAIKATIKAEEHRQYNTEYMLFSTKKADEKGAPVEMTDEEKAALLVKAEEVLTKVNAGETLDALAEKYKDANKDVLNFVNGDETASEKYQKAAVKLKNNEYSKVVETEEGYYVIKMVDNNSTEAYDAAVAGAINQEESRRFTEAYEAMKVDYKITENAEVWDTIVIGETIKEEPAVQEPAADGATTEDPATEGTTEDPATDGAATGDATTDTPTEQN